MNPEKSKLQKKETTKNTPETTLMFVVVRDNLKLIPIKFIRAIESKMNKTEFENHLKLMEIKRGS